MSAKLIRSNRSPVRWLLGRILRGVNHAAAALTRVGERHGLPWLVYNPLTFLYYFGRSLADAPGVMAEVGKIAPGARMYADVGAGAGGFAAVATRRGLDVAAYEYSATGRAFARLLGVRARPFDLSQMPPAAVDRKFDLAYCFEVGEHLAPEAGDRLVAFLARLAPLVVFSAAAPGQGGTGHVNEQPVAYWIERFEAQGLRYDDDATRTATEALGAAGVAPWFGKNLLIFATRTEEGRRGGRNGTGNRRGNGQHAASH